MAALVFSGPVDAREAFPGAGGHGKESQGGRGGVVIYVTTLADSGGGSLRACVEAKGPRNCVFRVSGTIRLKTPLGVLSENGRLSVLGQTAPGEGITLTIDPANPSHIKTPLYIRGAEDVVLRHIRVRLQYPNSVANADALTIEDSRRVYIDHFSGSWATDELVSTHSNTTALTISNSIFAEGLQPHSKCALLGSDPTAPQTMTFWRNACISNNDRNPDVNHFAGSCIEIVNNIFFNAGAEWAEVFSQYPGGTPVSIVGNYFKAGKSTSDSTFAINWHPAASVARPKIHEMGNSRWAPDNATLTLTSPHTAGVLVPEPACPSTVPVTSSDDAYRSVRKRAGAFPRDAIDQKLIRNIGDRGQEGRGSIKEKPGELLPDPPPGLPYADVDGDGMADSIEAMFGANAGEADAWSDPDGDGWSSFDGFMQWLSERRLAGGFPA
ncbi:MAG: polysaccharide lyase family 1 protein [Aestuariivirga sp.]